MNFYPPELGPILGFREYKKDSADQLFLLKGKSVEKSQFGFILIREIDGPFKLTKSFKLLGKKNDFTAKGVLQGLPLDTKFEFKATVIADQKKTPKWEELKESQIYKGSFKTSNANDSTTSFCFGSCCHFPMIKGQKADDMAFKTMVNKGFSQEDDFLFMLGDQIYGDHTVKEYQINKSQLLKKLLNFALGVKPEKMNLKHYLDHYALAFKRPFKRQVMASVPTMMTADDHEVHNAWGEADFLKEPIHYQLLKNGLGAYNIYQTHHPGIRVADPQKIKAGNPLPKAKYWYQFNHGKSSFFMLDVRYEKKMRANSPEMISKKQMTALKKWLLESPSTVKFIGSAVPFLPDAKKGISTIWTRIFDGHYKDRWEGFIEQRDEILSFIFEHKIANVFLLSGDVHCSFAFSLSKGKTGKHKVHQIVSSAFNWGIGLNDSHFEKKGDLVTYTKSRFIPKNLTKDVISGDNFCRIQVKTNFVAIRFYDAHSGECLRSLNIPI